jgi:septum formation inhibitor MinC
MAEKEEGEKYFPVHKVLMEMLEEAPTMCFKTICIAYKKRGKVPPQDIPALVESIRAAGVVLGLESRAEEAVKVLQKQLAEAEKAELEKEEEGDDHES